MLRVSLAKKYRIGGRILLEYMWQTQSWEVTRYRYSYFFLIMNG